MTNLTPQINDRVRVIDLNKVDLPFREAAKGNVGTVTDVFTAYDGEVMVTIRFARVIKGSMVRDWATTPAANVRRDV